MEFKDLGTTKGSYRFSSNNNNEVAEEPSKETRSPVAVDTSESNLSSLSELTSINSQDGDNDLEVADKELLD
ncbi:hypothetical protein RUND412_006072, partial [Rhizina undulata]